MPLRTPIKTVLVALLAIQLSGCGTLLYPERRGMESGRLDADVVVLDAIGLFFFLIPGVVAFAVDLTTGTIYLPQGEKSRISEVLGSTDPLVHPDGKFNLGAIEALAAGTVGGEIELIHHRTWVFKAEAGTNVSPMLEHLMKASSMQDIQGTPVHGWRRLDQVARAGPFPATG